jgi:glycosyltransferase involved in cell wall biosynthesis
MGDGAGQAIGGLARMGNGKGNTHKILLLDEPKRLNHINKCRDAGVDVFGRDKAEKAIAEADIVILSWWGSPVMDAFLSMFPSIPCRVLLWCHKNGYYDPPLPDALVDACDGLMAATPWTLENPRWNKDGVLVWGFGDFDPKNFVCKSDYSVGSNFTVGYVGMPGYKRFPQNAVEYFAEAIRQVPDCCFVLAGEPEAKFIDDLTAHGLGNKVKCVGWVADVPGILVTFDIFSYLMKPVLSATTENSLLEAMATGLPVAVSRKPIGIYLLEENESGFLFDDPKDFAAIIKKLRNDEILRKQAGVRAREYVVTNRNADTNLCIFNTVCDRIKGLDKQIHAFKI